MQKADLSYSVAWVLLAVLPVALVWYYRSLRKPCSGLPSASFIISFLKIYLTGGIPRGMHLTTYIFQLLNGFAKVFEREGIFAFWCGRSYLCVYSPDAVKFFITEPSAVEKAKLYRTLESFLGNGLLTSNGTVSAQHRKIINPTFHRMLYKSYMSVYNKRGGQLVEDLRLETEKPWIDLATFIKTCTLNVLLETVVGLKEDSVVNGNSVSEYLEIIETASDFAIKRISKPWLHYDFMLPFSADGRKHRQMSNCLHNFNRQILKEIMEPPEANDEKSPEDEDSDSVTAKCKPFIRSFVEAHRKDPESFTLEDIEDELTTFMTGGFHTISPAFISIIYLLGLHPDVQEKAFHEIEANVEGELTYEETYHVTYLESVIKETLRLYPAIPAIGRHLSKEVQFGKYTVPKNTEIVFLTYALHRNPETFPDPEKFDPDRFSPDKMGQYSRYSYMPFSDGPRYCIGKTFAMLQMKVLLTHILRNFKIISLDPRDKINFKWCLNLCNVDATRIQLIPR